MNRLLVRRVFSIPARRYFVLAGEILEGTLIAGAVASVQGDEGVFAERVESVESLTVHASAGDSQIALTFRYSNEDELARWQGSVAEGSIVAVAD